LTITYDPRDPAYYNESDLRAEMTRVYDLCHGCRLCHNLCPAFPSLFQMIDAKDGAVDLLAAAEQDRVVDECYQCKLCYVKCPYVPPHEWQLDFPRLLLRAEAVRNAKGDGGIKRRFTNQFLGRTDLIGKLATASAPLANALTQTPGSLSRRVMEKAAGIASERVLPPYARTRFTTWFKKRAPGVLGRAKQADVAVFPTCLVEYQNPAIGQDLIKVYEHNGVECSLVEGPGCCGAPWLHSGEMEAFEKQARKEITRLAAAVRQGKDIVVPQPTCGYVLKRDYVAHVGGPDAELVAAHTYDASEYLWRLHRAEATSIDTDFDGDVPETTAYHVPCHLQAQNIGLRSRDLIKLTGTKITLVNKCSGIDGTWGYRDEHYDESRKVAQPMARAITESAADVVAGDCHLANGAIRQETGRVAMHPLQLLARAYGIEPEPGERTSDAKDT
jgi:glycerol-3-phosphate dehydrogenase subunit C